MNLKREKGSLIAQDKLCRNYIIECKKMKMLSKEYSEAMKSVSDLGCQAFLSIEMQFLKKHPEVLGSDIYFKPFVPLFEKGLEKVDWSLVENTMLSNLKNIFDFDPFSLKGEAVKMFENDIYYFVTLYNVASDDKKGKMIGYITFLFRPDFPEKTLKVTGMAVDPKYQNRGLGKILMSAIFKIMSDVKRVFLCTRVTNEYALEAYQRWEFNTDLNPIQEPHYKFNLDHWIFLSYYAEENQNLQKFSESKISII